MFLIAGINPRLKQIGYVNGECPACGARERLHLVKESQALSLFFIPLVHFGRRYIATCVNCASVMELHTEVGKRYEADPGATVYRHEMDIVRNNYGPTCPGCDRRVYSDQVFCPGCGIKL